ncbi:MAG TPA: DUF1116 domain-containing protein [Candidatus Limnocylindrales bacterium]|nr:DUF1116 domain-containing protein [Candidatus Limnocylindrales bacterium]
MVDDKKIDEANKLAIERIMSSTPVLVDVKPAIEAIPGFQKNMFLCSGPPIAWKNKSDPVKGAILGAAVFEGMAKDLKEAEELASSGGITFCSTHDYNAVAPMAGIVSPSMPVFVVKNETYGNFAYSNMNEGVGQVKTLRFGANNEEVISRLQWMKTTLGPALNLAVKQTGGINLKEIIAAAIRRGDECHNRNRCATDLFFQQATLALLKTGLDKQEILSVACFMVDNPHFFLNMSMASSKATLNAAHGIEYSTLVSVMATNGVEFGIRISGLGEEWFEAPSPRQERGKMFKGFTEEDASPVFGDSYISEPAGIGAFAMAASPAIAEFVGGTPQIGIDITNKMYEITMAKHTTYKIPYLNYEGTPTGIDFRKVIATGITPVINTGLAHKKAGIGQVGAGVARAPMLCFTQAQAAFEAKYR